MAISTAQLGSVSDWGIVMRSTSHSEMPRLQQLHALIRELQQRAELLRADIADRAEGPRLQREACGLSPQCLEPTRPSCHASRNDRQAGGSIEAG
jgi:hypothetical protein